MAWSPAPEGGLAPRRAALDLPPWKKDLLPDHHDGVLAFLVVIALATVVWVTIASTAPVAHPAPEPVSVVVDP